MVLKWSTGWILWSLFLGFAASGIVYNHSDTEVISSKRMEEKSIEMLTFSPILLRNGTKRVVSYSLYGNCSLYQRNAVICAKTLPKYYSGWTPRFYVSTEIDHKLMAMLIGLNSEVVLVKVSPPHPVSYKGMHWRFWASSDTSLERYIVRDADSPPIERDREVVDDWERRGTLFHTIHDHPMHRMPIMGGLWGGVYTPDLNMDTLFSRSVARKLPENDQTFLKRYVWPIFKAKRFTCHTSFRFSKVDVGPCVSFPVKRRGIKYLGETDFFQKRKLLLNKTIREFMKCRGSAGPLLEGENANEVEKKKSQEKGKLT